MKLSLFLTALIVLGAAWYHHAAASRLEPLRQEAVAKRTLAVAAGLDAEAAARGEIRQADDHAEGAEADGKDRAAALKEKEDQARAFAQELITFALEMKEREKDPARRQPDEATQKRILAIMNRFMDMDEASLRIVVSELEGSSALESKTKSEVAGMSIMMLAQSDPAAALRLYGNAKSLLGENDGMARHVPAMCLAAWSAKEPAEAMAWLQQAENKEFLTPDTRRAVLTGMAGKDPLQAMRTLLSGKLGAADNHVDEATVMMIASRATPENRKALLDHVPEQTGKTEEGGMKAADIRRSILRGIAGSLADQGVQEAGAWMDKADLPPEQRKELLKSLSQSLHGKNPAPWLEWMGARTADAGELSELASAVVPHWTRENFNAVGDWLNGQPAGALRESVTRSFAETLAPYEPESAATWALTLPEGDARQKMLEQITTGWSAKDPEAALNFARTHGLPAAAGKQEAAPSDPSPGN